MNCGIINLILTLCLNLNLLLSLIHRIYVVHDEVKDKNFELELSWIGEGILIIVDFAHSHCSRQTIFLSFLLFAFFLTSGQGVLIS